MVIKSEVLPHIKNQESLISQLNKELETIKTKSKCNVSTNICAISNQNDPVQRMKENDMCITLLDERRKTVLNAICSNPSENS